MISNGSGRLPTSPSWSARGEGVTLYPLLLTPTPETALDHPTISLAGDVGATKLVIDSQPGPVILVGHSYGGVVITEAGTDPRARPPSSQGWPASSR